MKQVGIGVAVALLVSLAFVPRASAVLWVTDIYTIQMGGIPVGDSVQVDTVIVTTIDLKPTTYGITAQEIAGGAYSGVLCYMAYQRPDTVGGVGLGCGDTISVVGRVAEYAAGSLSGTVTEIDYCKVTIIGKGSVASELTPRLMTCKDIGLVYADSACAEKWEGVLLAVDTVKVTAHLPNGEWLVVEAHSHSGTCGKDTLEIDDKLVDPTLPRPNVGDSLALIRGALSFQYDNYQMWPRDDSDVVYIGLPPGPNLVVAYPTETNKIDVLFDQGLLKTSAENMSNYALSDTALDILSVALDPFKESLVHITTTAMDHTKLCILSACGVQSGFSVPMDSCQTYEFREGITPISYVQTPSAGDTSRCVGQQVTVAGIVSSPTAAFGGEYFMQARPGGQWNGMYVYQFTNTFAAGDSAVVSGVVQEYYGMTELVGIDYQKRIPIMAPVKIKKVTPAAIKTGSPTAESYEGAMVQLDSMDVFSVFDIHYEFTVGKGTDSVWIGTHGVYTYVPGIGSVVSIKGPMDFAYGNHKIQPRDDADIVVVTPCPAGVEPKEFALSLYQNAPNPFGVETSIRFSVPFKARVNLAVYDVTGRLVSSVYEQDLPAGEYQAKWNGRDTYGSRVSPGVYFVKLATPQGSVEKKMVLVE